MERVLAGRSTMKKGYYLITNNLLEYTNSDYITVKRTGEIYPKGSKFKVISYYSAFDNELLSEFVGKGVPEYLIRSVDNGYYFWVANFEFDSKSCKISDSVDAYHFDIQKHIHDKNITVTVIK